MPASPAATPPTTTPTGSDDAAGPAAPAPSTSRPGRATPKVVTWPMATECGCKFSREPNGPVLVCAEPLGHQGPHEGQDVVWTHVTGPAGATTPTEPLAGPPDLTHAIHAAKVALEATYDWDGYDVAEVARIAVGAAWPYAT